jgi:hypothetical protein
MFRCLLLTSLISLSLAVNSQAVEIYNHTFDGDSGTPLNGLAPDEGPDGVKWTAEGFMADGTIATGSKSAWLPYAFGSGIYEVTLGINQTGGDATSTAFGGISFTTASNDSSDEPGAPPFNTGYINVADTAAYATLAFRRNGNIQFWGGVGTGSGVAVGALPANTSYIGTLRLVLDTTGEKWTVDGYYIPSVEGVDQDEIVFDLNPTDTESTTYVFGDNQPTAFTGVGIMQSGTTVKFTSFAFSVVPEPGSFALATLALLPLAARRRVR